MKPAKSRLFRAVALLAFVLLVGKFVFSRSDQLESAWRVVSRFPLPLLGLAIGAQILRFLASGALVQSSARVGGATLSLWLGVELFVGGGSAGLLLGGAALTIAAIYRWAHDRGVKSGAASLVSWVPTAFDNLVFFLMGAVGLIHFIVSFKSSPPLAISSIAVLALLLVFTGVCFWAVRRRERAAAAVASAISRVKRLFRRRGDEPKMQSRIRKIFDAAADLGDGRWRRPFFWALASTLLDAASIAILFHAAGARSDLLLILTGFSLPQLVGRLTPIPGGVGLTEAGMIGMYTALGVPYPTAIAVVLGYRLISFFAPYMLGFGLMLHLEREVASAD